LAELDRALQLLGAVCQFGSIKDKHLLELETLLGGKVTQQLASHWKNNLKEIRRELAAELKREGDRGAPSPPTPDVQSKEREPGGCIRRMPREDICDGLLDEASDLRDALDSLAFGLRRELGVANEHALFDAIGTARDALDRITWMLGTRTIGNVTEAPTRASG
jgi:hypothetical protein